MVRKSLDYFMNWNDVVGGDAGFIQTGFLMGARSGRGSAEGQCRATTLGRDQHLLTAQPKRLIIYSILTANDFDGEQ